jgi:hypothetical protein
MSDKTTSMTFSMIFFLRFIACLFAFLRCHLSAMTN